MNIVLRFSCRTFQLCFRLAIPVLPYREPEVVGSAAEAAEKLERFKRSRRRGS